VEALLFEFEETYPKYKKLLKLISEFHTNVSRNDNMIIDYGKRYKSGKVISTAFVESTVITLICKRFVKKQQV